jgi:hypothetical protein
MEIRTVNRKLVFAAAAAATLLGATAAHASNVHWSVGIDLPPVTTVVGNGPAYYPAPVYGAPVYGAPAYYPEPVYYSAPAYSYYPAPVYYAPRVYAPRPRVWVGPARPYYGAPWRAPARVHDKYPHGGYAGRADWRR